MSEEIFRSENLLARARCGFSDRFCVVTFDSYTDDRTLERQGFGETYFASIGVDAIHVLQRNNRWYAHPEMTELCRAVHSRVQGYGRVITYGSSMGGYAAIRFGAVVGAQEALALSPQFSINPAVARFEKRWVEAELVDFSAERQSSDRFVARSTIAYDPRNLDARHVELYRDRTEVVPVAFPYAGHPCSGFLQQVQMLKPLVEEVLFERLDPPTFTAEAHRRRRQSPDYFMTIARHNRSLRRREQLAARAVALSQHHPDVVAKHAWWLAEAGDLATARATLEAAALAPDRTPAVLLYLSKIAELQGDKAAAITVMDTLLASHPEVTAFIRRRELLVHPITALLPRRGMRSLIERVRLVLSRS